MQNFHSLELTRKTKNVSRVRKFEKFFRSVPGSVHEVFHLAKMVEKQTKNLWCGFLDARSVSA